MTPLWLSERVYFDGDEYFQDLLLDLERSMKLVTVEMYIFNSDSLGIRVIEALFRAAARGVRIEIMIDGIGSIGFPQDTYQELLSRGVRLKTYHPLPFLHPLSDKLNLRRKLEVYSRRLALANKRNHRKIVTIDESQMYVGSFNITEEHTSAIAKPWKDIGVRVTGSMVKFAVLNFKKNWKRSEFHQYRKAHKRDLQLKWRLSPLRLNQNLLMKNFYQRDFFRRLKTARQRIWIITPYFIPQRRIIRELGKAARRGVDVQIITSRESDVPMFRTLQYFYYPYLLKKGVKVYQYHETVLHAKNYIIDDWTTVGTSNLNHRSLMHDLEVDLVIQDAANLERIVKNFSQLTIGQNLLTLEVLDQRPWVDRFLSRLFFLFKYWF